MFRSGTLRIGHYTRPLSAQYHRYLILLDLFYLNSYYKTHCGCTIAHDIAQ
jgi:hypothetical protein